jgi:hypothetical protein
MKLVEPHLFLARAACPFYDSKPKPITYRNAFKLKLNRNDGESEWIEGNDRKIE